jgi:HSP20 family protein
LEAAVLVVRRRDTMTRKEVNIVEVKVWTPFSELVRDWPMPRIFGEDGFRPAVDVTRRDHGLIVTVELAGVEPDDVDVTLENDYLVVSGEKTEEREVSEENRYLRERRYGSFQRRIPVPDGVKAKDIEAHSTNGVLTITVKLPAEKTAEPKKIPIT